MTPEKPSPLDLMMLRGIARYQFGLKADRVLIPDEVMIVRSPTTLRIRHILLGDIIILTLRPKDYLYSLHLKAGEILKEHYEPPLFRVVVRSDVASFIAQGSSVFAKHVVDVDPRVKAGSEVVIVDEEDRLIGVGRARLNADEMRTAIRGEAVRPRHTVSVLRD